MHFGQFILCALSLLGAACYGVIALIAMCVSLAARVRETARAVASMAGLMTLGALLPAVLATLVPVSAEGDTIAGVLILVWLAVFVCGLGVLVWVGVRTRQAPVRP